MRIKYDRKFLRHIINVKIITLYLYDRERARRRNCELDRGELSVVRLSPVKSRPRIVSLVRSPRALPTLELDTVLEERSDPEQTTTSQVNESVILMIFQET